MDNKLLVSKEEVTSFIPQQAPIVMVDALIYSDDKKAVSTFLIEKENMFVKDGFFEEPGIIENMAQTAALKAGYEIKKLGALPKIGFIGGIKNLFIYQLPAIGETLTTEIYLENEIFGITIVKTKAFCKDSLCAECELRIALQTEDKLSG